MSIESQCRIRILKSQSQHIEYSNLKWLNVHVPSGNGRASSALDLDLQSLLHKLRPLLLVSQTSRCAACSSSWSSPVTINKSTLLIMYSVVGSDDCICRLMNKHWMTQGSQASPPTNTQVLLQTLGRPAKHIKELQMYFRERSGTLL